MSDGLHNLSFAHLAALHLGLLLLRAEEAWEPVLLGGMIPMLGALAVAFIIWRAVRDKDEDDDE
jgi:hypothetical protein